MCRGRTTTHNFTPGLSGACVPLGRTQQRAQTRTETFPGGSFPPASCHCTPYYLKITNHPVSINTAHDESFSISSFLPCFLNQLLYLPLTSLLTFQVHNELRCCINFSFCSSHLRMFSFIILSLG